MKKLIGILLFIIGIIHLLPLVGVLGKEKLELLYGITINDNSSLILLQHRAVLFGLLGGFVCYAAFVPKYQNAAIIGALVSIVSFMLIANINAPYSAEILKVYRVDIFTLVCTIFATVIKFVQQKASIKV